MRVPARATESSGRLNIRVTEQPSHPATTPAKAGAQLAHATGSPRPLPTWAPAYAGVTAGKGRPHHHLATTSTSATQPRQRLNIRNIRATRHTSHPTTTPAKAGGQARTSRCKPAPSGYWTPASAGAGPRTENIRRHRPSAPPPTPLAPPARHHPGPPPMPIRPQ